MKSTIEVLDAFENIRRAQRAGVFAPHKPLLILLALARVQRSEPRLVEFAAIDEVPAGESGVVRRRGTADVSEFGTGRSCSKRLDGRPAVCHIRSRDHREALGIMHFT